MVAKLYTADVLSNAKPVKSTEPVQSPADPPKTKKPATEKQLAALAKAKEARRLKKEAEQAAKLQAETEATNAAEQEAAKAAAHEEKLKARREAAKERRKQKKLEKLREEQTEVKEVVQMPISTPAAPITPEPSLTEEPKKKKPRIKRDPNDPPQWFTKFVETGKQELNLQAAEKKPKKVVKEEAQVDAKQQWSDGYTRDRVTNEINNHVHRMYSMMFGGRKM